MIRTGEPSPLSSPSPGARAVRGRALSPRL